MANMKHCRVRLLTAHMKGLVFYGSCLAFKVLCSYETCINNTSLTLQLQTATLVVDTFKSQKDKTKNFQSLCHVALSSQCFTSQKTYLFVLSHICSFIKIKEQDKWIIVVHWSNWYGHSRQSQSQLVATLHCFLSTMAQFLLCEGKREAFGV